MFYAGPQRECPVRALATAGICLALLSVPVLARPSVVPVLDVQQVCRGIAEQGMDPSETGGPDLALSECVSSEQAIRDELVKSWASFAAADKDHCIREVEMGGESSYTDLITCLEMARDVRKMRIPHDHQLEDIAQ